MSPLLLGRIPPGGLSRRRRGWYRFVVGAGFGAAEIVGALTAGEALLSAAAGGGGRGQRRRAQAREGTGPTEG